MTEEYQSQKFLEAEFKELAKDLEAELSDVDGIVDVAKCKRAKPPHVNDCQLAADIGEPSPIATFISNTRLACEGLIKPPDQTRPPIEAGRGSASDRNAEFIVALNKSRADLKDTAGKDGEIALAKKLRSAKRFQGLQIADDLVNFTEMSNLDAAVSKIIDQQSLRSTAKQIFTDIGGIRGICAATPSEATEGDWNLLRDKIVPKIESGVCGCSLIYSYWLDEGGLQLAIERLADRVENGVVSTTEALRSVHISEASLIVDIISTFIVSWQRGELFDVEARRKQYQAQYGFPLHVASAWGNLSTADPRAVFPGAFHRLLFEASRYYDAQRDLLKRPIIEGVRSAIGQLVDALHEGNENMRRKRTTQIRGNSEYCKRLLGGSVKTGPIAIQWKGHLLGRPGIRDAEDAKPWQLNADSVASLYAWGRPRIKDYASLAESGETILVATRIGGPDAANDENVAKAFVELLKPHVLDYVNSFKVVAGVDLGQKLITAPPAAIMARKVRTPAVPPLKRRWAAVTPGAIRSSAA